MNQPVTEQEPVVNDEQGQIDQDVQASDNDEALEPVASTRIELAHLPALSEECVQYDC